MLGIVWYNLCFSFQWCMKPMVLQPPYHQRVGPYPFTHKYNNQRLFKKMLKLGNMGFIILIRRRYKPDFRLYVLMIQMCIGLYLVVLILIGCAIRHTHGRHLARSWFLFCIDVDSSVSLPLASNSNPLWFSLLLYDFTNTYRGRPTDSRDGVMICNGDKKIKLG